MPASQNTNWILDRLPEGAVRMKERMEEVTLAPKEIICEPGQRFQFAYFPVSSVLSSLIILEEGATVEAATIGREGMVGLPAVLGESRNPVSPHRILQQLQGKSLRIPVEELRGFLRKSPALRDLLERYSLVLIHQLTQNAACHRHHSVQERTSRWLLETAQRLNSDDFYITQEFLGEMLGASRQRVNLTARILQQANLISYQRGRLRIHDRAALAETACECYATTRDAYHRILGES